MSIKKSASHRLIKFSNPDESFKTYLNTIYGDDKDLINEKTANYIKALNAFIEKYGDQDVFISRAPGRVNLMGRHIEHRGGNINTFAINKETIMVAAKRNDDLVRISNIDKGFEDQCFSIKHHIMAYETESWIDYIESEPISKIITEKKGNWVNYIKAAVLRFQFENKHIDISGMDIMCFGDVPIAGGVSSSSSIVMAAAELVYSINNLTYDKRKFIELCGESEWIVGSRGGAGDHAAIKYSEVNSISPINFEPIRFNEPIPFSPKYSVIVANSFIEAKKSDTAKDKFNQMVASYEFGVMLLKDNYPQFDEKLIHLRDINTENLGISESDIYRMLLSLPLKLKPSELFTRISERFHEKIRHIIRSHNAPEFYSVRSAVLFGIAECERSKICPVFLREGKYEEFGRLMRISHDGDRVYKHKNGQIAEYDFYATDDKINKLINDSESNDYGAKIFNQPGGYACSVKEIDILTDKLNDLKGVLGSQISGAGLGGCIMILCEKEKTEEILDFLYNNYYKPNNLNNGALVVKPVKGSMCLTF